MKIMLVDDEDVIRLGLGKIISRMDMGAELIGSYANGEEAWEHLSRLQERELDLLITDIKMPMMDGLTLIEKVRERQLSVHIVVLSGFGEFEYARTALRHGVLDYLLKPVDKEQLYELLIRVGKERNQDSGYREEDGDHYAVEQVRAILDREYGVPFELERLAEQIGMNASYLSRLFKNKTAMTITDYLIHVRIDKAKSLLLDNPSLKNYEIAQCVGYHDPVYFNKLFKKVVGMTPRDYKERKSSRLP
ncbi:response regulator [Paenibacillus tarimensis]|uniref:response regulator n=1 Tax=Paenibacillus tarimensis TaxID=416012 RepID=UPI001F377482|nr:response regulator [Paenibacillus tarimensis]MCF2943691.1 response regulator [Paenibacillus tarimensis]